MIRIIRTYFKSERGATAVEFGIVSILFLVFLFGIFETGRAFWIMNRMQFAVETATRTALTDTDITDAEIETAIVDRLGATNLTAADLVITVNNPTVNGVTFKEVIAVYDFQTMTGFIPEGWGQFDITATSRIPLPTE